MKSITIISFLLLAITALALPQPKPAADDATPVALERKNFEPGHGDEGGWSAGAPAHGAFPVAKPTPDDNDKENGWGGHVDSWGGHGHDKGGDDNNWGGHDNNPWQPSKPTPKPTPTHPHTKPPIWTTLSKPSHWQPEPPKTTQKPSWSAWPPAYPSKTTTSSAPVMTVPAGWEWGKHNGWKKGGNGGGGGGGWKDANGHWKRGEGVDGWVIDHLLGGA